ncbi:MAG TPA: hypothetical protein VK968_18285 [Roseimicrobium sp.]|nr:hypothetical protein [Roseimicrobium sp.]
MPREEWNRVSSQIAAIVLNVLDLSEHPFTIAVEELARLMQEDLAAQIQFGSEGAASATKAESPEPPQPRLQMLFMPKPGALDELSQKFWRVQLLLLITAEPGTRGELALKLGFDQKSIISACKTARDHEVGDWSPRQSLQNIVEALDALKVDESSEFVLRGRILSRGSKSVRLSLGEQRYLSRLIQTGQRGASAKEFAKLSIRNITKLKSRLMAKLAQSELHLSIRPGPLKSHVLDDAIRIEPSLD